MKHYDINNTKYNNIKNEMIKRNKFNIISI